MLEIIEFEKLALEVADRISRSSGRLIGVEGHSTAGKTTLVKKLAERLNARTFHTDLYAPHELRNASTYVGRIDLMALRGDLAAASGGRPVVIEGICLREVLRGIDKSADIFIYCKRISAAGLWPDDPDNNVTNGCPADWLSWVDAQSVEYHLRHDPLGNADFVFLRLED